MDIALHWTFLPHTDPEASLATGDFDGTFERVRAGGAEMVQEPTEQPYGVRGCAFRAPAGNLVRINELG